MKAWGSYLSFQFLLQAGKIHHSWGSSLWIPFLIFCMVLFPMSLSLHPIAARAEWGISFLLAAVECLPKSHPSVKGWPDSWGKWGRVWGEKTQLECSLSMSFRRQGLGGPCISHPPGIQTHTQQSLYNTAPWAPVFRRSYSWACLVIREILWYCRK